MKKRAYKKRKNETSDEGDTADLSPAAKKADIDSGIANSLDDEILSILQEHDDLSVVNDNTGILLSSDMRGDTKPRASGLIKTDQSNQAQDDERVLGQDTTTTTATEPQPTLESDLPYHALHTVIFESVVSELSTAEQLFEGALHTEANWTEPLIEHALNTELNPEPQSQTPLTHATTVANENNRRFDAKCATNTHDDVLMLVIGDTHFSATRTQETVIMAENSIRLLDKVCDNIDAIVLLGDIIDRFHQSALKQATNWIWELVKRKKPLYLVVGNHDRPDHSHFLTSDHPFHGISRWTGVTVVDTARIETINGMKFLMVPYVPDGRFAEAIETIGPLDSVLSDIHGVFAHQTFYNARHNGLTSTTGDRWPLSAPVITSGHIHEFQRLQGNILYAGTPYQIKFGEPDNNAVLLSRYRKNHASERSEFQDRSGISIHKASADATHKNAGLFTYQRVSLDIPRKITHRLRVADLATLEHRDDPSVALTRYIFQAEKEDMLYSKQSPVLRKLLKNPKVVVHWDQQNSTTVNAIKTGPQGHVQLSLSFLEQLKLDATDAGILDIFTRVFGLELNKHREENNPAAEEDG